MFTTACSKILKFNQRDENVTILDRAVYYNITELKRASSFTTIILTITTSYKSYVLALQWTVSDQNKHILLLTTTNTHFIQRK